VRTSPIVGFVEVFQECVISGFFHEVDEKSILLGHYVGSSYLKHEETTTCCKITHKNAVLIFKKFCRRMDIETVFKCKLILCAL